MPAPADLDLLHGTLDVLVLKTLSWGPRCGYAVARWIKDTTDAAIQADIDEELRFHLDMRAEELTRRGMLPGGRRRTMDCAYFGAVRGARPKQPVPYRGQRFVRPVDRKRSVRYSRNSLSNWRTWTYGNPPLLV